jgi:hypothetical protein
MSVGRGQSRLHIKYLISKIGAMIGFIAGVNRVSNPLFSSRNLDLVIWANTLCTSIQAFDQASLNPNDYPQLRREIAYWND